MGLLSVVPALSQQQEQCSGSEEVEVNEGHNGK